MSTLWVRIVDASFEPITHARVQITGGPTKRRDLKLEGNRWVARGEKGERLTIVASAQGFDSEPLAVALREEVTQVTIGLRRPVSCRTPTVTTGSRLSRCQDSFLVRVRGENAGPTLAKVAKRLEHFVQARRRAHARPRGRCLRHCQGHGRQSQVALTGSRACEARRRDLAYHQTRRSPAVRPAHELSCASSPT